MASPEFPQTVDRILTVPNLITLVRLACLPLFVWLLLSAENAIAAGGLLGALGATDWVDGWYARRFHQVSSFGKIFDPLVDRLLFFVSIVAIIIADAAPLWFCVAVLVREIVVAVATLGLAAFGARRVDVTWSGKAATFGLMFAFPGFLWASTPWLLQSSFVVLAWACALPALVLSYYAAALYVPIGINALREGRASRS
ncbi:MAG: CDP-alcohol phosphatidyltransferase family protein [Acidimicrobiales bacterium]